MATEYPASNLSALGLKRFAECVESSTSGRLQVDVLYDNAAGISSDELVDAAQRGLLSGGDAFSGPLEAIDRSFGLSTLPFVFRSIDSAYRAREVGRPYYKRALAARGLHLLYLTTWPATGIWSKAALQGPEDLQGLAIRGNDVNSAKVFSAAGAAALYVPFNKAMSLVEQGKLDAIVTSGDGEVGKGLSAYYRYFTAVRYAIPLSVAFVRSADFKMLPQKCRQQVMTAAANTERDIDLLSRDRTLRNYEQMRQNDVTVVDPAPVEIVQMLKQASRPVVLEWQSSVPSALAAFVDEVICSSASVALPRP